MCYERAMIDPEFLKLLACPACKSPLAIQGDMLQCQGEASCSRLYRVENEIPVLLIEESLDPSDTESDPAKEPS
ncbi:MAG: hypothetical protein ACI97A_001763 [Planctomycetota bacterium]|jgi:uncharacterized protein YbaR (Trm112 family)